ncbi:jmjC domain-containing protein 8-like [Branchiostoma floridae]|uniref:JmjC domain-containing protein 8-like n=1 Tax=Branchiostoma floridae TaxID=7739 RepID=A0A9J7KMV2_BRAFL|nr:jmjC domain-containing protein 8-like [Branchiostoma floridae]
MNTQHHRGDDSDVGQHSHDQTSGSDPEELPLAGGWRRSAATRHKLSGEPNCDFDIRYANNLTKTEFQETYQGKEPLLLKFSGGAEEWTDTETWTRAGLVGKYGDHMAVYGYSDTINSHGGEAEEMIAIKDYVHVHMDKVNASSLGTTYLADDKLLKYGELQDKIYPPEYLQYFRRPAGLLFLGRSGLGLGWHAHGDAWNGVVFGEKHWYVYNRSAFPPGMHFYESADWVEYVHKLLPPNKRPLECTQEAGDIVYIPQDFHHSVVNVGETIAVAFRDNHLTPVPCEIQFMEAIRKLESEEDIRRGTDALRVNNLHYYGNPFPDFAVGMLYLRDGNYQAALENFRAALAVDRFNIRVHLGISDALCMQGRIAEAETCLVEAMDIHRSSVHLYEQFGKLKQFQGDLVTARKAYEAALRLRPDNKDLQRKVLALQKDLFENLE